MHCPACQHPNPAQANFCGACGMALHGVETTTTSAGPGGVAVSGDVQGDVQVNNTHTTHYHTQVGYAQNLAIGDGAQVVVAQSAPQPAPQPPQISFTLLSPTWPAPTPLLRVDLLSPTALTLRVCVAFENQNEVTTQTLTLHPNEPQRLTLSPLLPAEVTTGWAVLRAWVEGETQLLISQAFVVKRLETP